MVLWAAERQHAANREVSSFMCSSQEGAEMCSALHGERSPS